VKTSSKIFSDSILFLIIAKINLKYFHPRQGQDKGTFPLSLVTRQWKRPLVLETDLRVNSFEPI
jgi:hypothetical protein